ncbi:NAD(P)-binding protein [Tothia fuscella]|uniref:NAD(P)-binding protein n=1 Tax=Tothia fuscella TaxID=1048955 RepID=A0A9P4U0B9_9PEZI|nr:NAD(P)-binding protein [Tothia fuscella]
MAPSPSAESSPTKSSKNSMPKTPQFPPDKDPRVWFLTDGLSPIAIALSRQLLHHGDYIISGILPSEFKTSRGDGLKDLMEEVARESEGESGELDADGDEDMEGAESDGESGEDGIHEEKPSEEKVRRRKRWRERFKVVALDGRVIGQCQSAVAEALEAFDKIDVLVICQSEALVGSIEELSQSDRAQSLVRDQFETNFFAPVNLIKSMLPSMRAKRNGHIVTLTGITGHLGTPGLGIYCSSQWALEGYCDSLAYEVAPFNIKMTIVQPNLEITVLTNKITSVPQLPPYATDVNPAPLSREILSGLLDKIDGVTQEPITTPTTTTTSFTSPLSTGESPQPSLTNNADITSSGDLLHAATISLLYPNLHASLRDSLVKETVFALAAIGGHENPPARFIVGFEGVASVKEKLRTVSEELEDFIEVSAAVDIGKEGMRGPGGEGDEVV